MQKNPIIEVSGLNKHYGGVHALQDLDLQIYQGEILAIVGDNGAGKSTFINILAGTVQPDEADHIKVDGQTCKIKNPKHAIELEIQTVYQDLSLCNNLDGMQNIFLGREETNHALRLEKPQMYSRVRDIVAALGSNIPNIDAPVGTRSGGQRQAIAISRTAVEEPRVILLDEPTAALGVIQRKMVSDYTLRLKAANIAVVLVTQDLGEAVKTADRVAVLRIGQLDTILTGDQITRENMVAHITGAVDQVKKKGKEG